MEFGQKERGGYSPAFSVVSLQEVHKSFAEGYGQAIRELRPHNRCPRNQNGFRID